MRGRPGKPASISPGAGVATCGRAIDSAGVFAAAGASAHVLLREPGHAGRSGQGDGPARRVQRGQLRPRHLRRRGPLLRGRGPHRPGRRPVRGDVVDVLFEERRNVARHLGRRAPVPQGRAGPHNPGRHPGRRVPRRHDGPRLRDRARRAGHRQRDLRGAQRPRRGRAGLPRAARDEPRGRRSHLRPPRRRVVLPRLQGAAEPTAAQGRTRSTAAARPASSRLCPLFFQTICPSRS